MKNNKRIGTFHYNKSGLGYVVYNDGDDNVSVTVMATAKDAVFDGDTVMIALATDKTERKRRFGAKLVSVVSRKQNFVLGTLYVDSDGKEYVKPLEYIPFRLAVKTSEYGKFESGELVLASVIGAKSLSAYRVVPEIGYGRANTYGSATRLLCDGSCFGNFSPEAAEQARELTQSGFEYTEGDRNVYGKGVICPVSAQKGACDTAYKLTNEENSTYLYIYIIDVDAIIPKGSPVDSAARGLFRSILGSFSSKHSLFPLALVNGRLNLAENGKKPVLALKFSVFENGVLEYVSLEKAFLSGARVVSDEQIDGYYSGENVQELASEINFAKYSELAARIRKNRLYNGGVAVVSWCMNCIGEANKDGKHGGFEQLFQELLIGAGIAIGEYYKKHGIKGLFAYDEPEVFFPESDIPLYYRPLFEFCDVYTEDRLAVAARNCQNADPDGVAASCINFVLPPKMYSNEPKRNTIVGSDAYAPVSHPAECYDAVVQQRVLKALAFGEEFDIGETSEYTRRNAKAIEIDRGTRILDNLKSLEGCDEIEVLVVSTLGSVVARTQNGLLGELVNAGKNLEIGTRLNAHIDAISYDKREILFSR